MTYSLPQEDWSGRTRHVRGHPGDVLDGFDGKAVYVCGAPEMVVQTKGLPGERGVPDDRVITEGCEEDEVTGEG